MWNGSFWTTGADAGGVAGNITLTINGDGTHTATASIALERLWRCHCERRSITLRSASGRSVSLVHRGDALYAAVPDRISGYRVQVSVVKDSGALASPAFARWSASAIICFSTSARARLPARRSMSGAGTAAGAVSSRDARGPMPSCPAEISSPSARMSASSVRRRPRQRTSAPAR